MANFFGTLTREEVNSAETFAQFCQQRLGTPYPTGRQIAALKRNVNVFFEQNPQANYGTLVRTVDWCKNRRKRPPHAAGVISNVRFAFRDGYLPELNPNSEEEDVTTESLIKEAVSVETDPWWKDRLLGGKTAKARYEIYESWVTDRKSALVG